MQIVLLELPSFPLTLISKNCTSVAQKYYAKPNILICGVLLFGFVCFSFNWREKMISNLTDMQSSKMHAWHKNLRNCTCIPINSSRSKPLKTELEKL